MATKPSSVRWSELTHAGMRCASQISVFFSTAASMLSCLRSASLNVCAGITVTRLSHRTAPVDGRNDARHSETPTAYDTTSLNFVVNGHTISVKGRKSDETVPCGVASARQYRRLRAERDAAHVFGRPAKREGGGSWSPSPVNFSKKPVTKVYLTDGNNDLRVRCHGQTAT